MKRHKRLGLILLVAMMALGLAAPGLAQGFDIARIYIEYNESANDLGFHVTLDGEEWTELKIYDPTGTKIFDLSAKGGYKNLGLTELFFEGAEPNLDEFPLEELLALFPEGEYTFIGKTVDNEKLVSTATLSHDVPAGPVISTAPSTACTGTIAVSWPAVTGPAPILPDGTINVVAYQVIVGSFQVTVPASVLGVTVPLEYYQTLASGTHPYEVLSIDANGNQTITEGTFVKP
jgi:hypothetical protein